MSAKLDKKHIKKLEFTNSAITKWTPEHTKGGKTEIYKTIPFKVAKGSHLKGLTLRRSYSTRQKEFILKFWFNKNIRIINLGIFNPDSFNVKHLNDKLYHLHKKHTNDKGLWVIDPRITQKEEERKLKEDQNKEVEKKTIRETIEEFAMAGFPRGKRDGKLTARSISSITRYLLGYNKRTKHLRYHNDDEGNGYVDFLGNNKDKRFNPKTWAELFERFPPGDHKFYIVKGARLVSLYDDDQSKITWDKLDRETVKRYLNKYKTYGSKKSCLAAIKVLRHFAIKKNYIVDDHESNDPTWKINIVKPLYNKMIGSKYNETVFSLEQLEKIRNQCLVLREPYPFQAEMLMMMMFTGRRFEELSRLKTRYINRDERIIEIPRAISKIRRDEFITITEPVNNVLNLLDETKKRPGFDKYKFPPWLFCTPKFDYKRIDNPKYINSEYTKLKSVKMCWLQLRRDLDLFGSPKTFRKTFSTLAKDTLKSTGLATKLTGHIKDQTLDTFYYKHKKEEVRKNADTVAMLFSFPPNIKKVN